MPDESLHRIWFTAFSVYSSISCLSPSHLPPSPFFLFVLCLVLPIYFHSNSWMDIISRVVNMYDVFLVPYPLIAICRKCFACGFFCTQLHRSLCLRLLLSSNVYIKVLPCLCLAVSTTVMPCLWAEKTTTDLDCSASTCHFYPSLLRLGHLILILPACLICWPGCSN